MAADSSSTVLAELVGFNSTSKLINRLGSDSTSTLINPLASFDAGTARLLDLVVDASLGIAVHIKLSLPGDDAVEPTFVDLTFDALCPAGDEVSKTAQGNTICQPCALGAYESAGQCIVCPKQVKTCEEGSTVSDWKLQAGYWRTDDESRDVRKCRFTTSCPGDGKNQEALANSPSQRRTTSSNATGLNPYCAPNHVGPLCSACAANFFLSWAGDGECHPCATGESHAPTISLGGGVLIFVVLCLACVYKTHKNKAATALAPASSTSALSKIEKVYTLAKFKVFTLFLMSQVTSGRRKPLSALCRNFGYAPASGRVRIRHNFEWRWRRRVFRAGPNIRANARRDEP